MKQRKKMCPEVGIVRLYRVMHRGTRLSEDRGLRIAQYLKTNSLTTQVCIGIHSTLSCRRYERRQNSLILFRLTVFNQLKFRFKKCCVAVVLHYMAYGYGLFWTQWSRVRIPFGTWISVRIYVFSVALLCRTIVTLRWTDTPSKESFRISEGF